MVEDGFPELVGGTLVGTFVDRAGRVVLQFDVPRAFGSGPSRRLQVVHREVRIQPVQVLAKEELCDD